jgi:NADH-quinone oxidoreductase subunit M
VGEFLIFKGSFPLATWATSLAVLGLLATAIFILGVIQRVFSGPPIELWAGVADLSVGERMALAPAIALMFALGLWPQLVLGAINSTVTAMVQHLRF